MKTGSWFRIGPQSPKTSQNIKGFGIGVWSLFPRQFAVVLARGTKTTVFGAQVLSGDLCPLCGQSSPSVSVCQ